MLLRESTGGRSPFTTRYPFYGRQRNPRRQSKAYRVSSMFFLARLSHLATSALSFVSAYWAFLTAFLEVVQAPQRVQQKRKSWMMQVTQMIGMNTQAIIRSSRRSQPINQYYKSIQQLGFRGYQLYNILVNNKCDISLYQSSISYSFKYQLLSIMSLKKQWEWSTHYKFHTLKGSTYLIKKEGLKTWEDLVNELSLQTNFEYDFVQVVINSQKVHYEREALLVEVDIPKQALCLVLKREHFKADKDKAKYKQYRQALRLRCSQDLDQKFRNPQMESITRFVYQNHKRLLRKLAQKYKSLECIRAIYATKGNEENAVNYIQSGRAAKDICQIQKQIDIKKMRQFIQHKSMQQLSKFICEKKLDEMAYRGIMQKVYEAYPHYKELLLKHRKFVKMLFYGKSYKKEANSQQDQQEQLEQGQDYLRRDEVQKFSLVMKSKGFRKEDISEALYQAQNNLEKAHYLLESGLIDNIQNLPLLIKKQGRINYLLQFFANPRFERIRQKLNSNRHKAQSFLQWVAKTNEKNQILCILIKKYKQEALAFLTGTFVIEKKQKIEESTIPQEPELTQAEQNDLKNKIKCFFNKQMAESLVKKGFERSQAEAIVRAGRSQKQKVKYYEKFKGVHQQFDFCNNNKKAEQAFISKKLKSQQDLLKLIQEHYRNVWLASISETSPFLFTAIIRNYKYFTQLVTERISQK